MRLIRPKFTIEGVYGSAESIERIGRSCYKSEDKIVEGSADRFVRNIINRNHLSVIEHSAMTVRFIIDRGVSHELVRHRLCAFSQESTRYCNYKNEVAFVIPPWVYIEEGIYRDIPKGLQEINSMVWFQHMLRSEDAYIDLLNHGWSPQEARSVLPNSLRTEIVVTANFREWLHIFELRCSKASHPQMREIMIPLLKECKFRIPMLREKLEEIERKIR
ncbi:MAG: FAD-dependent thymidylate synthase [Deltaproteobacteria bacterium]|nr:FAD-dependent thymidylate synthase [Deltaproteobacteria bacterium]